MTPVSVWTLITSFPNARFIHIARDGRDAAISMRENFIFRLGLIMTSLEEHLGVDPLESSDRRNVTRVPAELQPFLPEDFDAEVFRAFRLPLRLCGEYWAFQVKTGLEALRAIHPDSLLTMRYEDFLVRPEKQLKILSSFMGDEFIDEDWSARCAATVRPPRSTWRDLPEDEAIALTDACRHGFELLREAGIEYEV